MSRRGAAQTERLLARLLGDPAARLVAAEKGGYRLAGPGGCDAEGVPERLVTALLASGLLIEAAEGIKAAETARAWRQRQERPELAFRAQHGELAEAPLAGDAKARVLKNHDESPVAALARRGGPGGGAWLEPHAVEAAERLRRDFEIGQLQPRVTANWSASVATRRRSVDGATAANLTDMALAARLRLDRAVEAVGPEFSGVLIDVCCFLKGMEIVERERQWPARSAKLVLRIALAALARHYGLGAAATGKESRRLRHWGDESYRPQVG